MTDACIDEADQIYHDIILLVNDIKDKWLDSKNIQMLIKCITDIVKFVQDFLATIAICSSSILEIGKSIAKMKSFDIAKRIL